MKSEKNLKLQEEKENEALISACKEGDKELLEKNYFLYLTFNYLHIIY
ncbi:hypothetical protein [uncultured Brachyspira sp.]|nr:hypothetical protein [uncultured Brachyspira sp.]